MYPDKKPIQSEPIKVAVVPIGRVRPGAPGTTGRCILRFKTPSRRIHWTLQVGWTGTPTLSTKTISIYPMLVDPDYGAPALRLTAVLSGATLPTGYEAESGVKEWEAQIDIASSDVDTENRLYAVMTWEPSLVEMCEAERTYWEGLCTITPVGNIDVGGSL